MAAASYLQTSFLGGIISPASQGRADQQETYRSGMNVCLNGLPIEEGPWTRRAGTREIGTTRKGVQAYLRAFHFTQAQPYDIEFTDSHMRFINGTQFVVDSTSINVVAQISTADPANVRTRIPHPWSTGDEVLFIRDGTNEFGVASAPLLNRQFEITVVDTFNFTIHDPVTGVGVDGSTLSLAGTPLIVARILDFSTLYTLSDLPDVRVVQNEDEALILAPGIPPYLLTETSPQADSSEFAQFSFAQASFQDGPYADPVVDGTFLTFSGTSGSITLTTNIPAWSSSVAYISKQLVTHSGNTYKCTVPVSIGQTPGSSSDWLEITFVDEDPTDPTLSAWTVDDVGRQVRLFSEPAFWDSGTAYTTGESVKYNGAYYTALANSTAVQPDSNPTDWGVATNVAGWAWGTITAVISATAVTVSLATPIIQNEAASLWRKGLYCSNVGFPTCGCYHEGRFWLGGALPNRFDASTTTDPLIFSPTAVDGTVADSSGISYSLEAIDRNTIFWMSPGHEGIVCGTQGGEWLIAASALNDPLTPTSIQAHRPTQFRSANVEPRRTSMSMLFVPYFNLRLVEYISDPYSGRFSGTDLARKAKNVVGKGLAEIAYTQEPTPIVWGRTIDNRLVGMTYRRESPFGTQPATFAGWHQHTLGSGRSVTSIQAGPSANGVLDSLSMITHDAVAGIYHIEVLTQLFDQNQNLLNGWFVDAGAAPVSSLFIAGTPNVIRFYGLNYLAGDTVSIMGGGLDLGDIAVSASGTLDVPVDVAGSVFTSAYLAGLDPNLFNQSGAFVYTGPQSKGPPPLNTGVYEYISPASGAVEGIKSDFAITDWDTDTVTFLGNTSGHEGWINFGISTSAQGISLHSTSVGAPSVLDNDGNIVCATGSTNSVAVQSFNQANLTQNWVFGAGSSVTTTGFHTGVFGLAAPWTMQPLTAQSNFLVSTSASPVYSPSNTIEVALLSLDDDNYFTQTSDSFRWSGTTYTTPDTGRLDMCRGYTTAIGNWGYGEVYMVGHSGSSWDTMNVYRFGVSEYNKQLQNVGSPVSLGSFTTADIDATWTHIHGFQGIDFDETDGNLIGAVSTTDSVTNPRYIIKISTLDGSIMWAIPVNALPVALGQSRVRKGRYAVLGNAIIYSFDTIAGTVTPITVTNVNTSGGNQKYDGKTGKLLACMSYTDSGGAPPPIAPCSGSFSSEWGSFPVGPPATDTVYFAPFAFGFTYTSQGQILRPLSPDDTGARNGPSLGKTRREHMLSALLLDTAPGIKFGTDFTHMRALPLESAGRIPVALPNLYSDVYWGTMDDTYSFNSMLAWQVTRPVPATVCAVEPFLHTQDR